MCAHACCQSIFLCCGKVRDAHTLVCRLQPFVATEVDRGADQADGNTDNGGRDVDDSVEEPGWGEDEGVDGKGDASEAEEDNRRHRRRPGDWTGLRRVTPREPGERRALADRWGAGEQVRRGCGEPVCVLGVLFGGCALQNSLCACRAT